jgi:uridine kinase
MLKQFGVKLNSNAAKVNASQPIKFDLTNSQLKKIKEKTQVDEEIYQYIKMKENKNAKQL